MVVFCSECSKRIETSYYNDYPNINSKCVNNAYKYNVNDFSGVMISDLENNLFYICKQCVSKVSYVDKLKRTYPQHFQLWEKPSNQQKTKLKAQIKKKQELIKQLRNQIISLQKQNTDHKNIRKQVQPKLQNYQKLQKFKLDLQTYNLNIQYNHVFSQRCFNRLTDLARFCKQIKQFNQKSYQQFQIFKKKIQRQNTAKFTKQIEIYLHSILTNLKDIQKNLKIDIDNTKKLKQTTILPMRQFLSDVDSQNIFDKQELERCSQIFDKKVQDMGKKLETLNSYIINGEELKQLKKSGLCLSAQQQQEQSESQDQKIQ